MPLAPGTRLGPYEVLAPLGAGGMGEVYRARDTRLGREVAVKVLPASLTQSAELRARFEREARTVSGLNHPNICVLHDVGREGDTDYLVMELVDGETLAQRLARGPLPNAELLRIGTQVADALDRAHRAGVVHRDLKPGNVMLTRTGAKLMDFGLARTTGMAGAAGSGAPPGSLSRSPTLAAPLTAEGTIVGTFQYMAPEQLEGREADARSDLWALGCVLYEMATGKRAFEGRSQASLIGAIMNAEPHALSQLAPLAPPGLERVVRQCLAKDPDDRWQSAGDLKRELGWISGPGAPVHAAEAPAARAAGARRRLGLQLGALAAVALATGLAVHTLDRPPAPPAMRFEIELPEGQGLDPSLSNVAVSPDGRQVSFVAFDSSGTGRIWLRDVDALQARLLTGTENAEDQFWSPDGGSLGFFADGKLKRLNLAGGEVNTLCDAPDPRGGSWGEGGTILFAPSASGPIERVSADGGTPAVVVRPDSAHGMTGLRWPQFLSDGRHFLVLQVPGSVRGYGIALASVSGDFRPGCFASGCGPVVMAGDRVIYMRSDQMVSRRFDVGAGRLAGPPLTLGEAPAPSFVSGQPRFSVSRGGVLVHPQAGVPNTTLEWLDRGGRVTGIVPAPAGRYDLVMPSPDGTRLAAVRRVGAARYELWLLETARPVASRISDVPGSTTNSMAWSNDGRWLAFGADPQGPEDVYRQSVDGGASELMLHGPELFKNVWGWTPDGGGILFTRPDGSNWNAYVLPVSGDRTPVPLLNGPANETFAAVSPDGRWLLFASDESGRPELYVTTYPHPGSRYRVSFQGTNSGVWTRDSRRITYAGQDGSLWSVDVKPGAAFACSAPQMLFKLRNSTVFGYPDADAKRFIASVVTGAAGRSTFVVELNWLPAGER